MKNVLIYLAILILAIPFAFGATTTLSPAEIYESVEADVNIEIDNYLGSEIIDKILINSPDLEITDALNFIGWNIDFSPSQITWSDGTIETNVKNALFVFSSKMPLVDQDSEYELTGTLYYSDLIEEEFILNITIRNDDSLPVLNSIFPADNSYARAYKTNQEIIINATDPETGIKSVKYEYSDCSSNITNVELDCNNGYCSGYADFSSYGEDDTACFTATLTNNAGDTAVIEGSFGFDETQPIVNLISPINDDYAGNLFSFDVQDNKAEEFECRLEIDSIAVQDIEAYTGVNAFAINSVIEEGMHDWKIICKDAVGLEGEDENSFIYDITAPSITLNSPENNAGIKDVIIDVSVDDNYEVSSVEYSKDLDSSSWSDGENILVITATDSAGNTNEQSFNFFVDRTAPSIEIISPLNNESLDYHGNFIVKATDNFYDEIECAISTSVSDPVSAIINSGEETTIQETLPLGEFTWSILCVDELGNSAQSNTLNAIAQDLTGPDIVIEDVEFVARGTNLEISAEITDISEIKNAKAIFNGNEIELSANNDEYSGVFNIPNDFALGDYSFEVIASDINDQESSNSEEFTVVESYDINLNILSSFEPNDVINIDGSVIKDDGSFVEGEIILTYTDGVETIALDENSEFSFSFTAPSNEGNYDVTVAII